MKLKVLLIEKHEKEDVIQIASNYSKTKKVKLSIRDRQSKNLTIEVVPNAYEAIDVLKTGGIEFDIILVDYFTEKESESEKKYRASKKQKKGEMIMTTYKSELMHKIKELQNIKDRIRKIQTHVWSTEGKDHVEKINRWVLNNYPPKDRIPVAIYSRHAKTLMKTNELFPLFANGIYLAWKPKFFSGDTVTKKYFNKANRIEMDIIEKILIENEINNALQSRLGRLEAIANEIKTMKSNNESNNKVLRKAYVISTILFILVLAAFILVKHYNSELTQMLDKWIYSLLGSIVVSIIGGGVHWSIYHKRKKELKNHFPRRGT